MLMPPAPKDRKIELDNNDRGRAIRRRVNGTGDTLQRSDKCGCTPQGELPLGGAADRGGG